MSAYDIYEVACKGKTYEVTGQGLDNIEKALEDAADRIREKCMDNAEREYEKQESDIAEDLRRKYSDVLKGAALQKKIEKKKREYREQLIKEAEEETLRELENYKEELLNAD